MSHPNVTSGERSPSSPPDSLRTAVDTPNTMAVVEHTDDGDYISVVDLATGHRRRVMTEASTVRRPVWSTKCRFLLFQHGNSVRAYVDGGAEQHALVEGLDQQATTAYLASPDDAWIAVALPAAVGLVQSPVSTGTAGIRRFDLPPECRVWDLLWSRDGAAVLALCGSAKSPDASRIVRIEIASGTATTQMVGNVSRLLGWQPSSGALVVSRAESAQEEVGELGTNGAFRPLRYLAEGEYVLQYLPATSVFVTTHAVDDQSDPAQVFLLAGQDASPRRWLEQYPRLRDVDFSSDGRWAVFVDRTDDEADGGDVYLAAVDGGGARRVLKAVPDDVSFSSPTVRPKPR